MPAPVDLHQSVGNLDQNTTQKSDPPKSSLPPPLALDSSSSPSSSPSSPSSPSSYAPRIRNAVTATATATAPVSALATTVQPSLKRQREPDPADATAFAEVIPGNREKMPLPPYRSKVRVMEKYHIIGFISSGTYGRVYKARSRTSGSKKEFAIKKQESTSPTAASPVR